MQVAAGNELTAVLTETSEVRRRCRVAGGGRENGEELQAMINILLL